MRVLMFLATVALVLGVWSRSYSVESPIRPVPPECVALLPEFSELELARLQQELLPVMHRLHESHRRMESSPNPEAEAEVRQAEEAYMAALKEHLSDEQLRRAAEIPPDPSARRQFLADRLVHTSGLSPLQQATLRRLSRSLPPGEVPEAVLGRYWQMVALVMTSEQMRVAKESLPAPLRSLPSPPQYLHLPGMSESQATQVLSLFRDFESEMTASMTRAQQLELSLKDSQESDRLQIHQEMLSLRVDMLERREQLQADLDKLLTSEQRQALASLPPGLAAEARELTERLALGAGLAPDQRREVEPSIRALHEEAKRLEPEVQELVRQAEEVSPQEPGGMARMMAVKNKVEPLERKREEVARQVLPLLTDRQLEGCLAGTFPPGPEDREGIRGKMERVQEGVRRWQSTGRDAAPVGAVMQRFEPLVQAGDIEQAERVLDEALEMLNSDGKG